MRLGISNSRVYSPIFQSQISAAAASANSGPILNSIFSAPQSRSSGSKAPQEDFWAKNNNFKTNAEGSSPGLFSSITTLQTAINKASDVFKDAIGKTKNLNVQNQKSIFSPTVNSKLIASGY